jgi:hypothetical protein
MRIQRLGLVFLAINLGLLALMAFTAGRSSAAQGTAGTTPVLRTRTLELVDAQGRVRSRLNVESDGAVVFRLLDQSGTIRVKLGADVHGSGLVLLDETTEPGVHILARRTPISGHPKTTSITLTAAEGRQQVITP